MSITRQMSPCDILRRSRMSLMFSPSFLENDGGFQSDGGAEGDA